MSNFSFSIVLSDNLNTEESRDCIFWKALFGGGFGLFGAVLLFTKRNKVWELIKLCLPITSQNSSGSYELPAARIVEWHKIGKSQDESESTISFGWDREAKLPDAL